MLRGLSIRNMLLIDRLDIEFQPGLNVLTGETGAGKSILLDCLGFVLGWRGRADLVREGVGQGEVTAEFELPPDHLARVVLDEAGLVVGSELVLRRVNFTDGRKRAFVNDRRTSGELLRRLSDTLVEMHGQHGDRGLLNPRAHRGFLDQFAGLGETLATTRNLWKDLTIATKALKVLQVQLQAAVADRDYLAHAVAELQHLAPKPGEDADLDAQRRLMQAGARIGDDIEKASLFLGSDGAEGNLLNASQRLQDVQEKAGGRLDQPVAALDRALAELGDAQQGVLACLRALDFNPNDLEICEERLFAIRALARKHDVQPDDLAEFGASMQGRLQAISDGGEEVLALQQRANSARAKFEDAAKLLGRYRRKAASDLDAAMALQLAPLKLERAVFTTMIDPGEPGPDGCENVSFTVATNPGTPAGPINKIASGGELSRFLLALKVCLTAQAEGQTMIFDEIDRGVGGATADAVGRRLAALAAGGQILVVTHSPQVAALGAHHWLVSKFVTDGQTQSTVVGLDATNRISEVARMLAGDSITAEARAAAKVLLAVD